MSFFRSKPPWYVAGLAFECVECGHCCAGPEEGYVWVTEDEVTAIAKRLGMDEPAFRSQYVRKVGRRYSLREVQGSKDCVFLTERAGAGRGCRVYDVRPTQCRTWPFWARNLGGPDDWSEAGMRCPGINRGPLVPFKDIEDRMRATRE